MLPQKLGAFKETTGKLDMSPSQSFDSRSSCCRCGNCWPSSKPSWHDDND
jgi:hypothetical protein